MRILNTVYKTIGACGTITLIASVVMNDPMLALFASVFVRDRAAAVLAEVPRSWQLKRKSQRETSKLCGKRKILRCLAHNFFMRTER